MGSIRTAGVGIAVGFSLLLSFGPAWAVTTEQTFRVNTTGDLVDLCSTPGTDPLHVPAVNFCEGFLVGAYQYHQVAIKAEGRKPLVCPPSPPPTRDEAVTKFIQWGRTSPPALGKAAVEGMFDFLSQAYPCPR